MESFGGVIGRASFNEPQTDDTTSAPPETVPSEQASPGRASLAQALLATQKKRKQRSSAALQKAMARARSAKPSARKWG